LALEVRRICLGVRAEILDRRGNCGRNFLARSLRKLPIIPFSWAARFLTRSVLTSSVHSRWSIGRRSSATSAIRTPLVLPPVLGTRRAGAKTHEANACVFALT
jgi:hypothetical protein